MRCLDFFFQFIPNVALNVVQSSCDTFIHQKLSRLPLLQLVGWSDLFYVVYCYMTFHLHLKSNTCRYTQHTSALAVQSMAYTSNWYLHLCKLRASMWRWGFPRLDIPVGLLVLVFSLKPRRAIFSTTAFLFSSLPQKDSVTGMLNLFFVPEYTTLDAAKTRALIDTHKHTGAQY